MNDMRWDEHEKNTHSDLQYAWKVYEDGGSERPLLLML